MAYSKNQSNLGKIEIHSTANNGELPPFLSYSKVHLRSLPNQLIDQQNRKVFVDLLHPRILSSTKKRNPISLSALFSFWLSWALSSKQAKMVAFCLKKMPTHVIHVHVYLEIFTWIWFLWHTTMTEHDIFCRIKWDSNASHRHCCAAFINADHCRSHLCS